MSSIRSASSSTSTSTADRSTARCCRWSISRPGVATTTSVPRSSAWICGPGATPPKIAVTRRCGGAPYAGERLLHLQRQFARRAPARDPWVARRGGARLRDKEAVDRRQRERGRLAGAGLRASEQIAATEDEGIA